uniref:Sushi domain-containing protein n=1 Tax=Aceria tosichella TaxID=561515 RepID=A0A6G1SNS1_9ACAR
MFSQNHQSRLTATKKKPQQPKQHHHQQQQLPRLPILISYLSHRFNPIPLSISQLVTLLFGPVALIYYVLSMSMFYQVMGATNKCRKIKRHSGIKLRPINKAKEPFMPNDLLLYTCESTEYTQTIRCKDDGSWGDLPPCPDPANFTCPDLEPIQHGSFTSTSPSPYKVGTVLSFKCENELLPYTSPSSTTSGSNNINYQQIAPTTTTFEPQNIFQSENITTTNSENITVLKTHPALQYNLTGHRFLKCLPTSKWNNPAPTCIPVYPDSPSNVGFLLASSALILIPILILVVLFHLFMRWRKRQQQRERWKQYFTDYKYRHSKTSITFSNRPNSQAAVPVTDL